LRTSDLTTSLSEETFKVQPTVRLNTAAVKSFVPAAECLDAIASG